MGSHGCRPGIHVPQCLDGGRSGVAIALAAMGFNLFGDALRDSLDQGRASSMESTLISSANEQTPVLQVWIIH